MSARAPLRWDIFCKVIDNYGDIGVCWRLARQLAHEHGFAVRLWVDDLNSFQRLVPEIDINATLQHCRKIEIRHWSRTRPPSDPQSIEPHQVADVVIEAFGCALPDAYVAAMAHRVEVGTKTGSKAPVWINLEYLSAEPWVESHHGLASPHPRLPLTKYFFFPGFTPKTGGLLCEAGLQQRRKAFQSNAMVQSEFWNKLGLPMPAHDELRISMFAYSSPETGRRFLQLLERWSTDIRSRTVLIPEGVLSEAVARFFGQPAKGTLKRDALTVHIFPFLDQDDYDRLLWACDVNFVRGEDSFVRAQWAGRPLVWQIYPQEEGVHLRKLDAFLNLYTQGCPEDQARLMRKVWNGWNQPALATDDFLKSWSAFESNFPALNRHAEDWVNRIGEAGDHTSRLRTFVDSVKPD